MFFLYRNGMLYDIESLVQEQHLHAEIENVAAINNAGQVLIDYDQTSVDFLAVGVRLDPMPGWW